MLSNSHLSYDIVGISIALYCANFFFLISICLDTIVPMHNYNFCIIRIGGSR